MKITQFFKKGRFLDYFFGPASTQQILKKDLDYTM